MSRGGEAAHVDPDLGDDHLRGAAAHPGNRDQVLELFTERADHSVHLLVQPHDIGRELVDVIQVHPQHQRVVGIEPALQGLPEQAESLTATGRGRASPARAPISVTPAINASSI